MEIEELIKSKVNFDPKFTEVDKEECYLRVKRLLSANEGVQVRLESDESAKGYAYWNRELNSYDLRIDFIEPPRDSGSPLPKASHYIVR